MQEKTCTFRWPAIASTVRWQAQRVQSIPKNWYIVTRRLSLPQQAAQITKHHNNLARLPPTEANKSTKCKQHALAQLSRGDEPHTHVVN